MNPEQSHPADPELPLFVFSLASVAGLADECRWPEVGICPDDQDHRLQSEANIGFA